MNQLHKLKTWPRHFEAIYSGRKCFELRINDRDYQVGDFVLLQEWEPSLMYGVTKEGQYTGRWAFVEVTYMLTPNEEQPEFVPDNWCILSIKLHSKGQGNG